MYKTFKADENFKTDEEIKKLFSNINGLEYKIKKSIHFIKDEDKFKTNKNIDVVKFINDNFKDKDSGFIYV
jgi:hypothetical protein